MDLSRINAAELRKLCAANGIYYIQKSTNEMRAELLHRQQAGSLMIPTMNGFDGESIYQ